MGCKECGGLDKNNKDRCSGECHICFKELCEKHVVICKECLSPACSEHLTNNKKICTSC